MGAMVRVHGGSFYMGTEQLYPENRPMHVVKVASFFMDVTETTVAEYAACVRAGACTAAPLPNGQDTGRCNGDRADRQDHPVNCVDWSEAGAYCAWASKRLPTEEEWEYATVHNDGRAYPWGDDTPKAQLCWNRDDHRTCPVKSFATDMSPSGVFDLGGNVAEWTASGWSKDYSQERDPAMRLSRGGSWMSFNINMIRAANRHRRDPKDRGADLGFRCAR